MAIKTFTTGEVLTASDTNTYLANSGLVYITSANATSGGVLNIDNIFSATYRNYRIVLDDVRLAGLAGLAIQLRVGGASNNTTYYNIRQEWDYGTGAASVAATANGTLWNIAVIPNGATAAAGSIDIYNPFMAQATGYQSQGSDSRTAGGGGGLLSGGYHNTASSFTGISITNASTYSNINATVYGYRIQ
jgi:hypothetical protein